MRGNGATVATDCHMAKFQPNWNRRYRNPCQFAKYGVKIGLKQLAIGKQTHPANMNGWTRSRDSSRPTFFHCSNMVNEKALSNSMHTMRSPLDLFIMPPLCW